MFCPNCGTQLEDDAIFCGSCGTKVQEAATATAPASKPLVSFNVGKMNFSIVKENFDILNLCAALVAFIALFLPYVTLSVNVFGYKEKESLNIFSATNNGAFFVIIILLFIAATVFGLKKAAMVCGYINIAFVIISLLSLSSDIADAKNELGGFSDMIKAYPNVGFYILLLASILMGFSWLIKAKVLPLIKK